MRPSNLKLQEPGGRVRHDDRGTAVWDWAIETDEFNTTSASALLRRLNVAELKMQESPGLSLAVAGRDSGGGGDPYNFRGSVSARTRYR